MSQRAESRKVTLVFSGRRGGYLHLPLSILCLAESLLRSDYEVRLVDLRIQELTAGDLKGALFLGVSHMSGSMQVPPALQSAKLAKSLDVPVVFGGSHPSILPEQTAAHPLVNIAVKGDGEEVVVDLAEYFQGKREIASIKGIAYKQHSDTVMFTGDRTPPSFDRVTHLPYDLLPMDKYLAAKADFTYQSSRGCPHRCAFCAEVYLYPNQWRAKPARVMLEEIKFIIEKFDPERICFLDSNFFCSRKRVEDYCRLVIGQGIKKKFFGECRFDYFAKYDSEFIDLIRQAGFNEIEFGGESGSEVTLSRIRKDVTTEQIIRSIEKCKTAGLRSFTSFMIGFPGESDAEMAHTLDMVDRIRTIDPLGARINGMFIYSPFPGTALYETVVRDWGYEAPLSLDDWASFELYDSANITWLDENRKQRLQTISVLVRYFFVHRTLAGWTFSEKVQRHGGIIKTLLSICLDRVYYPFAALRWRLRAFRLGFEWRLWQKIYLSYMGRK